MEEKHPLINHPFSLPNASSKTDEALFNRNIEESDLVEKGSVQGTKKAKNVKKRCHDFFRREIRVLDITTIEKKKLYTSLLERYTKEYCYWRRRFVVFKAADLFITVLLVVVQLTQVVIFQFDIPDHIKQTIATILPTVTAAALSIQLKLGWSGKGTKSKHCARVFKNLISGLEYRLKMINAGGEIIDTDCPLFWNLAMLMEVTEVPPFLNPY